MASDYSISNGVPMTVEQMQFYLQEHYGIPIVLRKIGTTNIQCPYCLKKHEHEVEPGHHVAGCSEDDRFSGVSILLV